MGVIHSWHSRARIGAAAVAMAMALVPAGAGRAELPPEPIPAVNELGTPSPHWAFYFDFNISAWTENRFVLMDADTADFLGMMTTGMWPTLHMSPDGGEIYISETYYTRGHRGERQDVVSIYDPVKLTLEHEIELPHGKRAFATANASPASSRSATPTPTPPPSVRSTPASMCVTSLCCATASAPSPPTTPRASTT